MPPILTEFYAVPVQAHPSPHHEVCRQSISSKGDITPDPQHGKRTKQRRAIIVNIDLDRKPACLAMLGGGRTLSPRDMVCTSSGGMVKTLALSRSQQSPLVVRSYSSTLTLL